MIHNKQEAFTLMEVLIAVVIIGILATLAGPRIIEFKRKMEINASKATLAAIETALHDYRDDMGQFPSQKVGGLDALVQRPVGKGAERWNGPYLKGKTEVPTDYWNREIEYNLPPNIKHKNKYKYYELISYGPNGEEDESDNFDFGE